MDTKRKGKTQEIAAKFENGWLDKLDGRLGLAQELRQRYQALTDDLGGAESLSYAQRSLCERSIFLEFWLAQQERDLAAGSEVFDVGKWVQAANSLQGLFGKLGLKRQAKDVPDLSAWLAKRSSK